jgi:hypothetical protein
MDGVVLGKRKESRSQISYKAVQGNHEVTKQLQSGEASVLAGTPHKSRHKYDPILGLLLKKVKIFIFI